MTNRHRPRRSRRPADEQETPAADAADRGRRRADATPRRRRVGRTARGRPVLAAPDVERYLVPFVLPVAGHRAAS